VQGRVFVHREKGGVSILGRVQSDTMYYALELSKDPRTDEKKWWILKNDRGTRWPLASGSYNYVAGAFYFLRLTMRGDTLTASIATDVGTGHTFVNLGSVSDHSFAQGRIGVQTWGTTASFDSVQVKR